MGPPPAPPEFAQTVRDFAAAVCAKIERDGPKVDRTEQQVRAVLINPFLDLLGYGVTDANHVDREVRAGRNRVDYLLHAKSGSCIALEAKRSEAEFGEKEVSQLRGYIRFAKAPIGILSNGRRYSLFVFSAAEMEMAATPFREINLLNLNDTDIGWLALLRRRSFDPRIVVSLAELEERKKWVRGWRRRQAAGRSAPLLDLVLGDIGVRRTARNRAWLERLVGREALGVDIDEEPPPASPVPPPAGPHSLTFEGQTECFKTQKDLYVEVFKRLGSRPGFYQRFSEQTRGPVRPQMSRDKASIPHFSPVRLPGGWWLNAALARDRKEKMVATACEVAGLRYGHDLVVTFATRAKARKRRGRKGKRRPRGTGMN